MIPLRCHHIELRFLEDGDNEEIIGSLQGAITRAEFETVFTRSVVDYLGGLKSGGREGSAGLVDKIDHTLQASVTPEGLKPGCCRNFDGSESCADDGQYGACEISAFLKGFGVSPSSYAPDVQIYQVVTNQGRKMSLYAPIPKPLAKKKDSMSFGLGFRAERRKKGR